MHHRRVPVMIAAAVAAVVTMFVGATPANAATGKNGVVEVGEFGMYYLQNFQGYVFDLFVSDSNFANDVFPGTGVSANNNTESDWNRDSFYWHVFTGASYTGSHGCVAPGASGNFNLTYKNNVESAYYSSVC